MATIVARRNIEEVVLVYSPQRAQRMLSPLLTTQSQLIEVFRLARFAPPAPSS